MYLFEEHIRHRNASVTADGEASEVEQQRLVGFERVWQIQSQVPMFLNATINIKMCNISLKEKAKILLHSLSFSVSLFLSVSSISVWGEGLFC